MEEKKINASDAFVIVGLQPWYTTIGSNCKHIARELSKKHLVLYVNSSLDRITVLKKGHDQGVIHHLQIIKDGGRRLNKIGDNLWEYYPGRILESINWIPFTSLFQKLNYVNNKRFAADIQEAVDLLGIKEYFLFNDNEIFRAFYLKELLKPKGYIYYCRDYLLGVDYWKRHGVKLEPQHIKKADFAMANSSYLADYLSKYNAKAVDVGQGCDTEMFHVLPDRNIPSDLKSIRGVKIGYVGALSNLRLDIKCLINIATKKPEWQLVLVGPEDEDFKNSSLHDLKNVHFLGQKKLADLPFYINGFDVCLNPQKLNEMTVGNYPLKIDEYLNMGKPVVATFTKAMQLFEPYTYLAKDEKDYVMLIEKAIIEDNLHNQHRRIGFANQHTWINSVKRILKALS